RRRSDGRLLWHYTVGSPVESSPVVIDGVDVFGAWNGTITALDLRTHKVRWRRPAGCKVTSSAALAGSTLYVGDYCGRLLALRVGNGTLRRSRSVNGRIYGTPAVDAGRVFVPSSTGGSLTAFSVHGAYLWRRSTGSYVYSSPAADAGRVFFGSYNGVLYALNARTGGTLWTVGTGGPIFGAAVVVDGVAYLGDSQLDFSGFDAVFHLAGQPGARSFGHVFPHYLWRNLLATQRVFEAVAEAEIPVVWASSSSVYGDAERYPTPEDVTPRPNNPYGVTKLACEQLHDTYERLFGLHAVGLRYFTVYGPRQRPDMAFARLVDALARDEQFEVY